MAIVCLASLKIYCELYSDVQNPFVICYWIEFVSHVEQLSWTPTVQGLHGLTPKGSVDRTGENWGEGGL